MAPKKPTAAYLLADHLQWGVTQEDKEGQKSSSALACAAK